MFDDDVRAISSSSASSISSLNTNALSPASLSGPSSYSSDRIYHLLIFWFSFFLFYETGLSCDEQYL